MTTPRVSITDSCVNSTAVNESYPSDFKCTYKVESCGSGYVCQDGACVLASSYTLTVSVSPSNRGSVTSNPSGIDCPNDCSESYISGISVTLTASAASSFTFTGWSGDCSGTSTTCTLTMNSNKQATAQFCGQLDASCSSDSDCCTNQGYVCDTTLHKCKRPVGGDCRSDSHCVSNACCDIPPYGTSGKCVSLGTIRGSNNQYLCAP